jgi:NAD(P)H-hydrate epimerase
MRPRIGIDVCPIRRMEIAVARSGERFLRRAFTPAELAYCDGRAERLAGRWAAKEAVIKCLDWTGDRPHRRQVEVLATESGAPRVTLQGPADRWDVDVTISHDGGLAAAAAVVGERRETLLPPPAAVVVPDRPPEGHKGTFGSVCAIAGSYGLTGAAFLCATAAARIGAGTVRLHVAQTIYPILAVKCTEVMASPTDEVAPGVLGDTAAATLSQQLRQARAGLIGPGLGQDGRTQALVGTLVAEAGAKLVIDADGLNALAADRTRLRGLRQEHVLTPHPGEMGRLLAQPTGEVQRARAEVARRAASEWGAVVVLKGAHTLVAAPDGRLSEDPHAVPALGTGGTGDVLAGVVAGLLAQGLPAYEAAVTGVFLHAAAGRRLAARQGTLLASDLLREAPVVAEELRQQRAAARSPGGTC